MHRRNQRPANPFSEGGRRLTYSNDPRYGQQTTRFERRSSGHIVPIFCFGILLLSSTFSWTSTPSPPPRLLDDAAKHPVKGFTSKQYLDLGYKARLRDNEEEKLPYHKPEEEKKEGSGDEHSNEHPKLAQKDSHDEDEDFLNENFHAMEENGDGIHEQIDERFSQDHKLNNTGSAEMDGQHHDPVIGEDFHVSVKTGEESKEFLLGSTNGEDNKNLEKSDFAAQSVLKTLESSKENETSPELENESTANLAKVESRNISTVDIATQNGFVSNAITNKTLGNASIAIPEFDDEKKSGYDASRNSYNDTDALTTFNNESEINESKNASVAFPETVEGLTNHSMESNETIIDTTEAVKSNSSGVADVEKTHSEKGSSGESNETLVAKGIVDYDNGEDLETPKLPDEDDEEDHEIELSREVVGNANITISESDNEEKNDYEASKNSYNKTDALNASDNETKILKSTNASVTFPENLEELTNHSMERNETITNTTEAVKSNSSEVSDAENMYTEKGSFEKSNETLVAKGIVDSDNEEKLETPNLPDEDTGEGHSDELSEEVVDAINTTTTEGDAEEKSDYDSLKLSNNETDALNTSINETEITASANASIAFPENVEELTNINNTSTDSDTEEKSDYDALKLANDETEMLNSTNTTTPENNEEEKNDYNASKNSYNNTGALNASDNETEIHKSKNTFPEIAEEVTNHSIERNQSITNTTEAILSNSSEVSDVENMYTDNGSGGESNETSVAKEIVDAGNEEELETPNLPDEDNGAVA